MNVGSDIALFKHYLVHTICENFAVKFIAGIICAMGATIYGANSEVINMIFLTYSVDFILGLSLAIKTRSFASYRFFAGGMKLAVYWILILIGYGVDIVMHTWSVILSMMFAFIFLRDASSILEKLHLLGHNVPYFLVKYLDVAQQRLDTQISKILDASEAGEEYTKETTEERTPQEWMVAEEK